MERLEHVLRERAEQSTGSRCAAAGTRPACWHPPLTGLAVAQALRPGKTRPEAKCSISFLRRLRRVALAQFFRDEVPHKPARPLDEGELLRQAGLEQYAHAEVT